MKNISLIILATVLLSCKQQKSNESNDNNNKTTKEMIKIDPTLSSGLNFDNVSFSNEKLEMRKYKYNDTYIENIKIIDLLNKEYRESFFKYLENSIVDSEDEFKAAFFSKLLLVRIIQLRDTDSFYLLAESSKNPSISYNGIEMISEYIFDDLLENAIFYIQESSKYNDITIIEYILNDMSPRYLETELEIKDPIRMCSYDNLKTGMILLKKDELNITELKKYKDRFKNEQLIEVDCSPTFATRENTTEEYYDIKSVIDSEIEKRLSVKDKMFYKLKIVPILKDYITK